MGVFFAVAHWLHFALAVGVKCPINGNYWAAYLCRNVPWWQGSVWLVLQSLKWNEKLEIVQIMCACNCRNPVPDLCWPTCVCLVTASQRHAFIVHIALLGPKTPSCKNRIGISCHPTETKLNEASASTSHYPPAFSMFPTFSASALCPIPSSLPGWGSTANSPTARGFKSGGQPCICVSKVRLRCRMLSFSGRCAVDWAGWQHRLLWVMCETVWKDMD